MAAANGRRLPLLLVTLLAIIATFAIHVVAAAARTRPDGPSAGITTLGGTHLAQLQPAPHFLGRHSGGMHFDRSRRSATSPEILPHPTVGASLEISSVHDWAPVVRRSGYERPPARARAP